MKAIAATAEKDREIAELRAERQRLEANWLPEQKERLANAHLVEVYSAVKAKLRIETAEAERDQLRQQVEELKQK